MKLFIYQFDAHFIVISDVGENGVLFLGDRSLKDENVRSQIILASYYQTNRSFSSASSPYKKSSKIKQMGHIEKNIPVLL